MNKKYILYLLLFTSLNVTAQQIQNNSSKQETKQEQIKEINFSQEELYKLNEFLEKGQFQEFFSIITSLNVSKHNYIKYLISKANDGYIPIYWLMAEHYAKENNAIETHKWYYIALIMTQQDSYLCTDRTSRNAPRILMKAFPASLDLTRKTPQHIESAMMEVSYFISNIKRRKNPDWVCFYGEESIPYGNSKTIPKQYWESERLQVYKRFTDKFAK